MKTLKKTNKPETNRVMIGVSVSIHPELLCKAKEHALNKEYRPTFSQYVVNLILQDLKNSTSFDRN